MLITIIFTSVFFASLKRGLILPLTLLYSVIPIRYFSDAPQTHIGNVSLGLDSIIALIFIFGFAIRITFSPYSTTPYLRGISSSVIFFIAAMLSGIVVTALGSLEGIKMLIRILFPLGIFILTVAEYQSRPDAQRIISWFILIGVLISLFGLIITIIGSETFHWSAGIMRYSPIGSISDFSYLMGIMTILTYVRFRFTKGKIFYGFLVSIFFIQCLLTVTRGGIFATAIAILGIELFGARLQVSKKIITLVIVSFIIFLLVMFYSPLRERIFATHYSGIDSDSMATQLDNSFAKSGRGNLWSFVISNTVGTPYIVLGHGLGSVETEVVRSIGGLTHSEYMRTFYEQGVVGLILFCSVLYQLWKIGLRCSSDAKYQELRLIALMLMGMVALYAAGSLVDNMISKYKNMGVPLYMLTAFTLLEMRRLRCFSR